MTEQELEKLEKKLMNTRLDVEETQTEHLGLFSNGFYRLRRFAFANPKIFTKVLISFICMVIFISTVCVIYLGIKKQGIPDISKQTVAPVTTVDPDESVSDVVGAETDEQALEGFGELSAQSNSPLMDKDPYDKDIVSSSGYTGTNDLNIHAKGDFFVSPIISGAKISDSIFQIGDTVFTLPTSIRDFEESGMKLITLGSLTPAEGEALSPKQRDGYIQYQNEKYYVRLQNGEDCTYHDLKVIGIVCENAEYSFRCGGGFRIGDSEASLPQSTTSMSYSEKLKQTYYDYGTVEESETGTKSGKMIEVAVTDGKVVKLYIFDDGTVRY